MLGQPVPLAAGAWVSSLLSLRPGTRELRMELEPGYIAREACLSSDTSFSQARHPTDSTPSPNCHQPRTKCLNTGVCGRTFHIEAITWVTK